jgi:hypothetical protein
MRFAVFGRFFVPGLSHWLANIPESFTMAVAIAIGSVILVCLVLFHGMGIHYILSYHRAGGMRLRHGRPHIAIAIFLFGTTIFLLLSLHIAGVLAWSVLLNHLGLITDAQNAVYFCANAYTTLGYGTVDLDPHYRIISPIIGLSGLFTFAWTTGAMVSIVQSHNALLERLHEEKAKQRQLRLDLSLAIHNAKTRERDDERHESMEITQESVGAPLYGRWQRWRDERQKVKAFRQEYRRERDRLVTAENAAEDALGTPPPSTSTNGASSAPSSQSHGIEPPQNTPQH